MLAVRREVEWHLARDHGRQPQPLLPGGNVPDAKCVGRGSEEFAVWGERRIGDLPRDPKMTPCLGSRQIVQTDRASTFGAGQPFPVRGRYALGQPTFPATARRFPHLERVRATSDDPAAIGGEEQGDIPPKRIRADKWVRPGSPRVPELNRTGSAGLVHHLASESEGNKPGRPRRPPAGDQYPTIGGERQCPD